MALHCPLAAMFVDCLRRLYTRLPAIFRFMPRDRRQRVCRYVAACFAAHENRLPLPSDMPSCSVALSLFSLSACPRHAASYRYALPYATIKSALPGFAAPRLHALSVAAHVLLLPLPSCLLRPFFYFLTPVAACSRPYAARLPEERTPGFIYAGCLMFRLNIATPRFAPLFTDADKTAIFAATILA